MNLYEFEGNEAVFNKKTKQTEIIHDTRYAIGETVESAQALIELYATEVAATGKLWPVSDKWKGYQG